MKNTKSTVLFAIRCGVVAASLVLSVAHADDYTEVSQMVRAGKLAEALAKADQYLSSHPKDPQMRFLKGVILRDSGKTPEAITSFVRLTEDYPELPEPYNNLAVLYAGQGQYDKARTALEMSIRTNPSYSTAHENLGDVYAKLASQAYNKALQLDSSNAAVGPKLALIRELFNPTGKGQRPSPLPAPTSVAAAPTKAPMTLPAAPADKTAQTPTKPASAGAAVVPATAAASAAPAASATTTAAKPAPASPVAADGSAAAKEVEAAVRNWAVAWSAKDVKTYLGAYGKDFVPAGSMSRSTWEEERRKRITGKASISVKLENLQTTVDGNKATAKFRQDYRANELSVSSHKTLELVKSADRWHIVKESVGR